MKLAFSNIAWKPEQAESAYALMKRYGARGLEVAPGLLFSHDPDPFSPSESLCRSEAERHMKFDLTLVSMQSLLFGASDAKLFGTDQQRNSFSRGLVRAINLASRLGIGNLVVGSPANRVIPLEMPRHKAMLLASNVFAELAEHAKVKKCRLALEPNPTEYGTNFLNDVPETADFVRALGHQSVAMNLDLGALHLNGDFDQIEDLLSQHADIIAHVHVSEPHLGVVPGDKLKLAKAFSALAKIGWDGWVSIEMRAPPDDQLAYVENALRYCASALHQ